MAAGKTFKKSNFVFMQNNVMDALKGWICVFYMQLPIVYIVSEIFLPLLWLTADKISINNLPKLSYESLKW